MAAWSSPSRRPVGKLVVRLSTGAEKRRVRAPSPYYETKPKALLEPGVAQIRRGGSEEHDGQKEYPECGEDDMHEPINTDEARDSMVRDSWMSSGQESEEFTGDCCSNGFLEHPYTEFPRLDFDLCIDPRLRYDTSSSRGVTSSVGKAASAGPATVGASTSSIITPDSLTPWNSAIGSPMVALWGGQSSKSEAENEGLSTHNIDDMFTKLVEWKNRYLSQGNPTNSIDPPHFLPALPTVNVNPHTETKDAMSSKLAEWKCQYLTAENSQQPNESACSPSPSLPAQVDFVAQSVGMMWKSRYQTADNPQESTPILTFPVPTLPVLRVDEIAESVQNMYSELVDWKHRNLTPENPQNMIEPPLLSPTSLSLLERVCEIPPHTPDEVASISLEPVGIIHPSTEYLHELVEPSPPYKRPLSSQHTKWYSDSPELKYINYSTESGIKAEDDRENLCSPPNDLSPKIPKISPKRPRETEDLGKHEVIFSLIRHPSPLSSTVPIKPF